MCTESATPSEKRGDKRLPVVDWRGRTKITICYSIIACNCASVIIVGWSHVTHLAISFPCLVLYTVADLPSPSGLLKFVSASQVCSILYYLNRKHAGILGFVSKKAPVLGWVTPLASNAVVTQEFWVSCMDCAIYSLEKGLFSEIKTFRVASSDVSLNRNKLWEMAKEEGCDYLFSVDWDMVFHKDTLERLLESEKAMPDCVYTGYAGVGGPPNFPAFWLEDTEGKGAILWDYPRDKRFEVDFIGGYGFLVPPSILHSKDMPRYPFIPKDGRSEDHSFSKEVRNAGYKLIVDPTLVFGHLRLRPITEKDWDIYKQELDPKDYVVYPTSPPKP